jgi:hypothetical protein
MDSILFDGVDNPTNLEEVVGQAVGAASVCWESMEGTGIFQEDRARQIVDDVVEWIKENYIPAAPPYDPEFVSDLSRVINYYSKEKESDTPDFILAESLAGFLNTFDKATNARTRWYKKEN